MKWALIVNESVANIVEQGAAPSISGEWVQAGGAAIGWVRVAGVLQAAPQAPASYQWYIDPGSFRDRFGEAKILVLSSQDATVKALLTDMSDRPWIDLQRADVAQGLAYIGSVIPQVSPQLQSQILTTPPTAFEQLVLRGYFK